jgi:hypothetical protein
MEIRAYISELKEIRETLPKKVDEIIHSKESYILGMLKKRLFDFGVDGDGKLIGTYSNKTKILKKKKGQRTSFITLRDTGDFYKGMFIDNFPGRIFIDSRDSITNILISIYGQSILELTVQEQQHIIDAVIEPEINKILAKLGDVDF